MSEWRRWVRPVAGDPAFFALALVGLAVLLLAVLPDFGNAGKWVLWGWGGFALVQARRRNGDDPEILPAGWRWSVFFLIAALTTAFYCAVYDVTTALTTGLALWALAVSWIALAVPVRRMFAMALPAAIWLLLTPSETTFYWLLSYPMSRLGALLSVAGLEACGVAAECQGTVMYVVTAGIAVTTACSGVDLFEVMLAAGWMIVNRTRAVWWLRLLLYLWMAPLIVLLNALRLLVLAWLYAAWNIRVFVEPWHSLLGLATVAAVMLLMMLSGELVRRAGGMAENLQA